MSTSKLALLKYKDLENTLAEVTCKICNETRMVKASHARKNSETIGDILYINCHSCAVSIRTKNKEHLRLNEIHEVFRGKKWRELEKINVDVVCPICNETRKINGRYAIEVAPDLICACKKCRTWKQVEKRTADFQSSRFEINGCILVRAREGRCERYSECEYFNICLDEVDKKNWNGWRILKMEVNR
jgi:hypothetical protein